MGEREMLNKSGRIALSATAGLFVFISCLASCFSFNVENARPGRFGSGTFFFENISLVPGTGTDEFVIAIGTQSQGQSGTSGLTVDITSNPRLSIVTSGGSTSANFIDFPLQQNGVPVGTMSVSTGDARYILQQSGTGTGNTLSNLTIDGTGTNSATMAFSGTLSISGTDISDTEISYLDGLTGNINTFQTSHAHGGTDSTQISHNNVTGTGTNDHPAIDTFIASKASASGLASLDSDSLVVQNPASGSTTASANNIPIADGSGLIDDDWMSTNITKLGATIELGTETTGDTDNINEGSTNLYYTEARVNANRGSATLSEIGDVTITAIQDSHRLAYDSGLGSWINATDTAVVAWSGITGVPTDNGSVSTTASSGHIPVAGDDGKLDYSWHKDVLRLPGTTTEQTFLADNGQMYVYSSDVDGAFTSDHVIYLQLADDFADDSYNNFTPTVNGSATIIGTATAAFFGNDDDSVTYPDDDLYNIAAGGEVTIRAWLNFFDVSKVVNGIFSHLTDNNNVVYFAYMSSSNVLRIRQDTGGVNDFNIESNTWNASADTWYFVEINRNSSGGYEFYVDGSMMGAGTDSTAWGDWTGAATVGDADLSTNEYGLSGYMSNFEFVRDDLNNGTYTDIPTRTDSPGTYKKHLFRYVAPGSTTPFIIETPGTATAEPSYIMLNGSTTILGAGTTTAVEGTTTSYAAWVDGAIRATAFNVASQEKIKENIEELYIGAPKLMAEAMAKKNYIKNNRQPWFTANEANYTYIGTDSSTYIDYETMQEDYSTYIELEWAADGSQTDYIKAVEDESKKTFWNTFDSIKPKKWNPKDRPEIERKGLVVEEVPEEILGDNKLTIDPMKIISYNVLVQQALKADNIRNMRAHLTSLQLLETLVGTQTSNDYQVKKKIKELEDRLNILAPTPTPAPTPKT